MMSSIGKRAAPAIAIGWALFHLSSTAVGLMPDNPVRRAVHSPMVSYIGTFWDQNWHLFSPNPPTNGEAAVVRCVMSDGTLTPYMDTAAGVTQSNFDSPIGPYPKLKYLYKGVYGDLNIVLMHELRAACGDTVTAECQARAFELGSRSPQGAAAVELTKDICMAKVARGDVRPTRIDIRYLRLDVFPYSKRAEIGSRRWYKRTAFDLPPIELEPTIASSSSSLDGQEFAR